jgi:L-ascorbate metabolism protein UlaG (beta-lactamase superfamily)
VGFAVRVVDRPGALWVSGDTVPTRGVRQVARRFDVDIALLHLGGVRFPVTGPVRYSMTGAQAVRLLARLRPRVAVPVHHEGWSHVQEGEEGLRAVLDRAPAGVRSRVHWLERGVPWEAGGLVD